MGIALYGQWRLRVTEAIHNWENRFVVQGATSGNGIYPPTIGSSVDVNGTAWELQAQYREHGTTDWLPSDMNIITQPESAAISATIGSEDPLPQRDFEDIQWQADYLGDTMYEVPYRPFAVRPEDLFQMPDGIFETLLGDYYMGVRIINRWGLPFTTNHILDISPNSRADLASRGILVSDNWSQSELQALGQQTNDSGIVIGPLKPGEGRTIYFKVNVASAAPRKHNIEFICWNTAGMSDPFHPMRRITQRIFVSRTTIDKTTGEVVSEVRQGTLRMRLKEFAFDKETAYKRRRKKRKPTNGRERQELSLQELRQALQAILEGKNVDPCLLQRILNCYCVKDGDGSGGGTTYDPYNPCDGRFVYEPFYIFPTKFSYAVTPRNPFPGQYGPIPFDDPWWKCLLLIIALILLIAAALEEAADVAYHDEDLIIGTLDRWEQNDIDAALCRLDTDRDLGFRQSLDAQSDEDNQNFISSLDGVVNLAGPIMTRAEIDALRALPVGDPQRKVFKSGATTGLTHGEIWDLVADGHDKSTWSIDQLLIRRDPDFGEDVSIPGDSGSVWVHTETLRPVALNHSGSRDENDNPTGDFAWASLLEDVFSMLEINF